MLKKITKYGLFLVLLMPLIISRSTFFPFIFGKAIFFQVIIEILFIFFLVLLAQNKIKLKFTKINIALIVFYFILILSTLFSLDITRSFWSTSERMTGLFNYLHFGLFFLMLTSLFKKRDFIWFLRLSLAISVFINIYAMYNWESRLSGTLGNPGFLACYVLFHVFFALYLFFKKQEKIYWRIFYILLFIYNLITLYYTSTRGAYYGLFIGLLIFSFLFALKKSKKIGISLLIIFILFGSFGVYLQKERFLKADEARQVSWKISYNAFKQRPILGWGPENYILAFAKHYDPDWPITEWFDKAHSNFWEFTVTTGALGLLAYLGIFFSAGLSPILIAYFIMQLFWIDTTITLMLFFITLALIDKKVLT